MSDEKPKFPPFIDLHNLNENQRCRVIAETVTKTKGLIGFIVDHDEKIITRYIRKIKERAPNVTVERIGVLTEGAFALKAFIPTHSNN